mmetsp:Transcript_56102/g.105221  ORF Transcript_56102/g.105221 Transcript_56102/m.105221 type:complete len:116 (-) Transcript_56102:229-576(-)
MVVTLCGIVASALVVSIPFLCGKEGSLARAERSHRAGRFRMPLMPFFPLLGMFMNVLLASQMSFVTLMEAAVLQTMGAVFYFAYSSSRSHLNRQQKKVWTPVFDGTIPPAEDDQS